MFVTMQPKDDTFLMVFPIITVQEGDFLLVFAGEVRYSSDCNPVFSGISSINATKEGASHVEGLGYCFSCNPTI